jgi:putative peptidoglycan lipid II flippase
LAVFRSGLLRVLVRTGLVSLLGKGAGFLVPIFAAAWFGAGAETDAFFLSYAVVFFAVGIWGTGLETVAISQVARWTAAGGVVLEHELSWARRWVVGCALATMLVLGVVEVAVILPTISDAVSRRESLLAFLLLAPMLLAVSNTALLTGGLAAAGHFSLPAGTQSLRGVGAILGALLLRHQMGVLSLAVGYSAGELARWALLSWHWRRLRGQLRAPAPGAVADIPRLRREVLQVAWPQLAALAIVGTAPLVERWASGGIGAGAISYLDYAMRLYAVPSSLFDASVAGVLQSYWADHQYRGDPAQLTGSVRRTVVRVFAVALAATALCWFGRGLVVGVVLRRGAFTGDDARVVARVFGILMLGFPAGMAALVLERAFMALQGTGYLLRIAVAKITVRSGIAIVGAATLGVTGVALAQPLTSLLELTLLAVSWGALLRSRGVPRGVAPTAGAR